MFFYLAEGSCFSDCLFVLKKCHCLRLCPQSLIYEEKLIMDKRPRHAQADFSYIILKVIPRNYVIRFICIKIQLFSTVPSHPSPPCNLWPCFQSSEVLVSGYYVLFDTYSFSLRIIISPSRFLLPVKSSS